MLFYKDRSKQAPKKFFERVRPNYTPGDMVIGIPVDFACGCVIFDTGDIIVWPPSWYNVYDRHNPDNRSRNIMLGVDTIAVWWEDETTFRMEFVD